MVQQNINMIKLIKMINLYGFMRVINNMFKVKENDIFEKNMSQQELHKVWTKMKWDQEMDEWFNQLEIKYNEVQENKYY